MVSQSGGAKAPPITLFNTMKSLEELIEKGGEFELEQLAEAVQCACDALASNANNEGIAGQVAFLTLIAGLSEREILETIHI